jgi:DNA-binding LacI/PurR family transcriptional regulator
MFKLLPQQVAETLSHEIGQGTWSNVLPSERALAERFQVSRKTIRAALALLRRHGTLRTVDRKHTSVVQRPTNGPEKTRIRVGMLLPAPLEYARPFTVLWVNHLSTSLRDSGVDFELVHNRRCFRPGAAKALATLTHSMPKACWILGRSTQLVQAWFQRTDTPAVIAGSSHRGISLPSVDLDYRALCRHAAGELLRRGHTQLAFLHDDAGLAGDRESIEGFTSGCASHAEGVPPPLVAAAEPTPGIVTKLIARWLRKANPPTAILISSPGLYLTVLSYLGSIGVRVPKDLSLVCRDEEPFFRSIVPAPAYYRLTPEKFASSMHRSVIQVVQSTSVTTVKLLPDFFAGASVSRPPGKA